MEKQSSSIQLVANAMLGRANNKDIEALLHRRLAVVEEAGDLSGLGEVCAVMGIHLRDTGEAARSRSSFQRAITCFESGQNLEQVAEVSLALAKLEMQENNLDRALKLLERSLELHERGGSSSEVVADDCHNLAMLHRTMGELRQSAELFQRSIALRGGLSQANLGVASSCLALGNLLCPHDLQGATRLFESAVKTYQVVLGQEDARTLKACSNLATAYHLAQRTADAKRLLLQCVNKWDEAADPKGYSTVLKNLGMVLAAEGDEIKSKRCFDRADKMLSNQQAMPVISEECTRIVKEAQERVQVEEMTLAARTARMRGSSRGSSTTSPSGSRPGTSTRHAAASTAHTPLRNGQNAPCDDAMVMDMAAKIPWHSKSTDDHLETPRILDLEDSDELEEEMLEDTSSEGNKNGDGAEGGDRQEESDKVDNQETKNNSTPRESVPEVALNDEATIAAETKLASKPKQAPKLDETDKPTKKRSSFCVVS